MLNTQQDLLPIKHKSSCTVGWRSTLLYSLCWWFWFGSRLSTVLLRYSSLNLAVQRSTAFFSSSKYAGYTTCFFVFNPTPHADENYYETTKWKDSWHSSSPPSTPVLFFHYHQRTSTESQLWRWLKLAVLTPQSLQPMADQYKCTAPVWEERPFQTNWWQTTVLLI